MPKNNNETDPRIHFDDPRYLKWKLIYETLLADTPPALREVLEPSLGTLASRLTEALYDKRGYLLITKCLECGRDTSS